MKTFRRILFALIFVTAIVVAVAYVWGTFLPLDHTVSVSGTVAAPPDKVFALIANPADGSSWRRNVKSVKMLTPTDKGQQRWIEDLGHGRTMQFLAVASDAPNKREVSLDVPSAAYGGSWIFELSPGPKPDTTTLTITEAGFIRAPLYRVFMRHVLGLTSNVDQYLADVQRSFPG